MIMQHIQSIDDPRVAAYRNLRDRTLRGENIFVAEGQLLTQRLLASPYETESIFVSEDCVEQFAPLVPEGVPLYVAPEPLLLEIVGFKFHRGALGAGRRGCPLTIEEMLSRKAIDGPLSLVVCPEITKPENLGLIFRTAVALGVDGLLLGERCCDPFSRRCLRVSMGSVLSMPFTKSTNLTADLHDLKGPWGVELLAAVLDPVAQRLIDVAWPLRAGLVFGNEFDGIRDHWLDECHQRVTIPMHRGTDSLNLGVAAGIFVYDMMKRQRPARR